VLDQVTAASCEPTELIYRDWRTGNRVAAHPVRNSYQARFGAPYYGIHRADLQRALSGALGAAGLHLGYRLCGLRDQGGTMRLDFDNGHVAEADLVVGADGVRSMVRQWVTEGEGVV